MKQVAIILTILMLIFSLGCANGAGKKIAKGAVRGASHGVVEEYGKTEIGKGAAHGALSSTQQVVDQNRAEKKAAQAAE